MTNQPDNKENKSGLDFFKSESIFSFNFISDDSTLLQLRYPFAKKVSRRTAHLVQHPVFSSQSAGSVYIIKILLASHRATLHDFKSLSYGPVRALA
jgi:hypothetical protein